MKTKVFQKDDKEDFKTVRDYFQKIKDGEIKFIPTQVNKNTAECLNILERSVTRVTSQYNSNKNGNPESPKIFLCIILKVI